jgi:nicotinamide riboside kinase
MTASSNPSTVERAFVVGIVGAESTGKTVLASQVAQVLALATAGVGRVALVSEYLREFCESHGRTPRDDEQRGIADEQARRIDAAAAEHDVVVADTTPLMIAVYSEIVFGDTSLYARAEARHRRCDLTLLTALDLPWQPDGLQRDGPHVREPVDALIRASLIRAGASFSVIAGAGDDRLQAALRAIEVGLTLRGTSLSDASPATSLTTTITRSARWSAVCADCGDPDCERRLLHR